MLNASAWLTSLLIVSIVLTLFFTLPQFYSRHQQGVHGRKLYQDNDGTSTKISQFAFDRERRVYKYLLSFVNIVGFVVNAGAIFPTTVLPNADLYQLLLLIDALKASAAVRTHSAQCQSYNNQIRLSSLSKALLLRLTTMPKIVTTLALLPASAALWSMGQILDTTFKTLTRQMSGSPSLSHTVLSSSFLF